MKYVIIGNSAAAVGCIEGIRKTDREGRIVLISDETFSTYSRPLISYWLSGKVEDRNMRYRDDRFYERNDVEALLGCRVVSIDPTKKSVAFKKSSGDKITEEPFDRLLVATGSRPFIPPVEGIVDCRNAVTFQSWEDAKILKSKTDASSRVAVLGAGLIGLKVAEGLAGHVRSVTIVEMAAHLMPSVLDDGGAEILQNHIEKSGVRFLYSDPASRVGDNVLTLASGAEIPFDVLVVAAGVRPNVELLKEAGGRVGRGIEIDSSMKTSLEDIYAAGDCVESQDVVTGSRKIMALLPNAYLQGETAGINMAGGCGEFHKAMPMNAIGFFGLPLVTAGDYEGESYISKSGDSYKRLYFKDDRLVGYILINDVDRAGIYTAIICEKVDLKNVNLELLREKPQLMLFRKSDRERILSGGSISPEGGAEDEN